MTEYLEPEQAVEAVRHLGLHVRDQGLLFSALARPQASAFGEDAYASLELKAAALMTSIAKNHALFDGNKRFSWYLTLAFFKLNGYRVVMTNDEAFDLVLKVAQGSLDLDEIADDFARHLVEDL
ncbi:MAG TPA: type II toxin-antitoxin system death-on-curing family toxin [Homoserinimonas sp.]|nr:type II toxin-antitoxin system death-on-curing family toxin [Homoserinimonas sp.]